MFIHNNGMNMPPHEKITFAASKTNMIYIYIYIYIFWSDQNEYDYYYLWTDEER